MADDPISYLALRDGTEVRAADGTVLHTSVGRRDADPLQFQSGELSPRRSTRRP